MIPTPTCHVRGLGRAVFSLSFFSLVLPSLVSKIPCGRGGVREHPSERTRTGGTEPARHRPPEMVPVSAGRDGAVRPPWILRNRPRAAVRLHNDIEYRFHSLDILHRAYTCQGI